MATAIEARQAHVREKCRSLSFDYGFLTEFVVHPVDFTRTA